MSLVGALQRVAIEFPIERQKPFKGNELANFIRQDLRREATHAVKTSRRSKIVIDSSAGLGNWNSAPWVAFFDSSITRTARTGYYPVLLFEEGFQSYCLVLGQGTDLLTETLGKKLALVEIESRAKVLRNASAGWQASGFSIGPFDTKRRTTSLTGSKESLPPDPWSVSAAFGKRYLVASPPTEAELGSDLDLMLGLYEIAVASLERRFLNEEQAAVDLAGAGELPPAFGIDGVLRVQEHKRLETKQRNQRLVTAAKKKHGFQCQGCEIDMAIAYPSLGPPYIEAHHLSPLANLPDEGAALTVEDFAVLCPSCHRAIHRMGCPSLDKFRDSIPGWLRDLHRAQGASPA
ncbi:MrcB family domain-containing protein [Methylibium sp.]|uniref:MrcB family domain-containing protein n=1 Tax=Methylibium sp. TaxID=2067992 RepID=UPI003D0E0760